VGAPTIEAPPGFDGYGISEAAKVEYAPRMLRSELERIPGPFRLLPDPRGSLQSLKAFNFERFEPKAGEVLLQVQAGRHQLQRCT
jgi:hypothetical protein